MVPSAAAAAARRVTYDRDMRAAVAGDDEEESMPAPSPRMMSGVSWPVFVPRAALSLSLSLGLVLDDGREDAGLLRDSLRCSVVRDAAEMKTQG